MAKKRKTTTRRKTTVKRRTTTKRKSTTNKIVGYTKVGSKFALVLGSKSKPRLGSKRFSSKANLFKAVAKR